MTSITTDRVRKSVQLSKEEYRLLVKWVNNQLTKVDAALLLGVTRSTLDRIILAGTASPDSYSKILKVIQVEA